MDEKFSMFMETVDEKDARMKRAFISVYRELSGKPDFEKNGFKIVLPYIFSSLFWLLHEPRP